VSELASKAAGSNATQVRVDLTGGLDRRSEVYYCTSTVS
jgi:hypothetical protein